MSGDKVSPGTSWDRCVSVDQRISAPPSQRGPFQTSSPRFRPCGRSRSPSSWCGSVWTWDIYTDASSPDSLQTASSAKGAKRKRSHEGHPQAVGSHGSGLFGPTYLLNGLYLVVLVQSVLSKERVNRLTREKRKRYRSNLTFSNILTETNALFCACLKNSTMWDIPTWMRYAFIVKG